MPIASEMTGLRQFWHDSPPLVVILFGLALVGVWYRTSPNALSYLFLDAGILVFLAGVALEILWLTWLRSRMRSRRHLRRVHDCANNRRAALRGYFWSVNGSLRQADHSR